MKIFKMTLTTAIIICTILAGVFALGTAILQIIKEGRDGKETVRIAKESELKQREISQLQSQLLNRSNKIIESQEAVASKNNKIISLQTELSLKNDEIHSLQTTTLNKITGGSAVPHIKFTTLVFGNNLISAPDSKIRINLINNSEFPVRGVIITYQRYTLGTYKNDNTSFPNDKNYNNSIYEIGDLFSNTDRLVEYDRFYKQTKEIRVNFTVQWLYGFYTGDFIMHINETGKVKIDNANLNNRSKDFDFLNIAYIDDIPFNLRDGVSGHQSYYKESY